MGRIEAGIGRNGVDIDPCQSHFLGNIAAPVAKADETMKVSLRKQVRAEIGELIRPEQVESPGVLTVTGLLRTPIEEKNPETRAEGALGDAEMVETEFVGQVEVFSMPSIDKFSLD